MKNKLLLCLALCAGGIAHADDGAYPSTTSGGFMNGTKLYAGGSVGVARQGDTCNDPFFSGSCTDKTTGWKVFGGARLNPMFGAEASYNDLGKASKGGTIAGTPATLENNVTGVAVSGVGYVPVAPRVEAFGKAGAMFWNAETSKTQAGTNTTTKSTGTSPLLGVGAQYQLNDNLHLRGEWEHVLNVGSGSSYETNVDLYSVGLLYSTL